jgi:uncharacterized protein
MTARRWWWLPAIGVLCALGCTTQTTDAPAPQAREPATRQQAPPSPTRSPSTSAFPQRPVEPVSLPAMMQRKYDGHALRTRHVILRTDAYTRYYVTYRSDGLRISGIMNVPDGNGPFPVLVLNHGYIDPADYVNGQGLSREQDFLARAGYVALHTDYRGHAGSQDAPATERRLRLGYTADVINAVRAIRRSDLPYLDKDRVGLLGRSMGGGVTYNALVVRPDLVDAAVVYAPVSSNTVDNFERWIRGEPDRRALSAAIIDRYGAPERDPEFWRGVSPRTYFDRVEAPILVHHGTADASCPIRWSRRTVAALERAGRDVRMFTYPGEPHAFIADWELSMRRSVRFLDRNL